ncbi:unnamed protein product [Sphagnum jensenii]|uniref:CP12 domain-containing protein n=1 Tax=Sphagnum jensenii TaxID=128206 RepID=A0ABP0W2R6_9BRYO
MASSLNMASSLTTASSVALALGAATLSQADSSSSSSQLLSIRSTAAPRPACPFLATRLRVNTMSIIIVHKKFPVVAMASPGGSVTNLDKLYEQVEESIAEAQEVCVADETSGECRVAWDKVEELSAEVAHRRTREQSKGVDPLVEFCKEAPEADECRVYED